MHPLLHRAASTAALVLALVPHALLAADPLTDPADIDALSNAEVERRLLASHPAHYFIYASRLFHEGHHDDAVFWFYVAQLRFRFHLAAHPSTDPSGDPALFGGLHSSVGSPINRYAGGDIPNYRRQIARALKWDADTPNDFTSKRKFSSQWKETRAGLEKLSTYLEQNADTLMKQREDMLRREADIAATPPTSAAPPAAAGPITPMPADWPALEPRTTTAMLAGSYPGGASSPFARAFFGDQPSRVMRAYTIEVDAPDQHHLRLRAMRDDRALIDRTIDVQSVDDALVFTETAIDLDAGKPLGPVLRRVLLRKNTAGELVIERRIFLAGTDPSAPPKYTFWTRAVREPPTP